MSIRILITGSRSFADAQVAEDALNAALVLAGSNASPRPVSTADEVAAASPVPGTLVHGAAQGADLLLAGVAQTLGMAVEAHPAKWNEHSADCPAWDLANTTCRLAGFRRNTEMIRSGVTLAIAFPTHPQKLAPGQDKKNTSRGTWHCAEEAQKSGLTTFIAWGDRLYPFGGLSGELLAIHAQMKRLEPGPQGSLSAVDVFLPF